MMLRRLRQCEWGATMVEFALVAPMFFLMLFGLIEFGRAYWTRQTLIEIAFHTARCSAIDSACGTQSERVNFAVQRAQAYSTSLPASAVTVQSGVTCRNQPNSISVAITRAHSSPLTGFGFLPSQLQASACFPAFSGSNPDDDD